MNEMEVEAEDTHRLLEAEKARVASLETHEVFLRHHAIHLHQLGLVRGQAAGGEKLAKLIEGRWREGVLEWTGWRENTLDTRRTRTSIRSWREGRAPQKRQGVS